MKCKHSSHFTITEIATSFVHHDVNPANSYVDHRCSVDHSEPDIDFTCRECKFNKYYKWGKFPKWLDELYQEHGVKRKFIEVRSK